MTPDARDVARLYKSIYGRSHQETGPRLVGKSNKYVSRKRLFAVAQPYVDGVSFDGTHRLVEVPSAWHALCVAMSLQEDMLKVREQHLVFRGQSNSSYALVPSIYRPGADVNLLTRAKQFMAWFLASNAGLELARDPVLFHGAAQHYQIWTNLLDITPDPAVAVWFASLPTRQPSPSAAVYCFTLEHAERLGLNLRLPPPFVTRLYRQRGVFIEFNDAAPLPMDGIIEIRFPSMRNTNRPFEVMRGPRASNLLEDDRWIREVVTWAKNAAATDIAVPVEVPTGLDGTFALYLKAVKAAGIPAALLDDKQRRTYFLRWLDQFNELLYWLAYRFNDDEKGAEEVLEPRHVARIVQANRGLAQLYVQAGRSLGTHRSASFHQQLDLVEATLSGT